MIWDIERLGAEFEEQRRTIAAQRVTPLTQRGEVEARFRERYDFTTPVPLAAAVEDVIAALTHDSVHTVHPRYYGLFNPSVRFPTVIADLLVAAFNPQVGGWFHSPAACEIERVALRFFADRIGYAADAAAHFTSCGSEANLTGVLCALVQRFPSVREHGIASLKRPPAILISEDGHHSFEKIAQHVGLGRATLHRVPVDERRQMSAKAVNDAIAALRRSAAEPFLVVATAGTTAAGAIDPLRSIAEVCAAEDVSLHVDAAWGGAALLSDNLCHLLDGIDDADSVTWDAHKTLPIAMSAGMFFTRHPELLDRAFGIDTSYVPNDGNRAVDGYRTSLQWSRRFIGLKVFLTLAELGAAGVARLVEQQARLAGRLHERLIATGWEIASPSSLPIVCAAQADVSMERVRSALLAEGEHWISVAHVGSRELLRICITSIDTTEDDIISLVDALNRLVDEARRELTTP